MTRLKQQVAFVLLALWSPSQFSWVLALLAAAGDSHHISVASSNGAVDVVLHHHPVAWHPEANVVSADEHTHGDHVIRGSTDRMLAASKLAKRHGPSQACIHADSLRVAGRTLLRIAAPAPIGPSPPLGTVVLRI